MSEPRIQACAENLMDFSVERMLTQRGFVKYENSCAKTYILKLTQVPWNVSEELHTFPEGGSKLPFSPWMVNC